MLPVDSVAISFPPHMLLSLGSGLFLPCIFLQKLCSFFFTFLIQKVAYWTHSFESCSLHNNVTWKSTPYIINSWSARSFFMIAHAPLWITQFIRPVAHEWVVNKFVCFVSVKDEFLGQFKKLYYKVYLKCTHFRTIFFRVLINIYTYVTIITRTGMFSLPKNPLMYNVWSPSSSHLHYTWCCLRLSLSPLGRLWLWL